MTSISELIEMLEKIKEDEGNIDVFNLHRDDVDTIITSEGGNKILLIW